ncbi:MAG: right-handed parallel beta-helix repeat-containing protein [Phycisphaerales bacterium]|jgi:hypothetical protein|nr:right-handed parallel beta-helix repeat-containing protein [Phycisphaerales bacterium]
MATPDSIKRLNQIIVTLFVALAPWASNAWGVEYYVSPAGNDAWSGRLSAPNATNSDGPFKTLKQATQTAKASDTCYLRKGVYRETLRPAHSGKPKAPITFCAYKGEHAIISGADLISGWRAGKNGEYSTSVSWDLKDQNQLFADGKILTEARWPDIGGTVMKPVRARAQSGSLTTLTDKNLTGPDDAWKGAMLWCAGGSEWICWAVPVTGYNAKTHTLTFDTKQKSRWYIPRKGNPYVLIGSRRALDSDGEWLLDASKKLHLRPPGKKAPNTLKIEMKRRLDAIDLSGRSHIRIIGLRFRAAGVRTDTASSDIVLQGLRGVWVAHSYKWDITGKSGVLIHGRRIAVRNCELAFSSGSVLDVRGSDNTITNCYIHDGNYGAKWRGTLAVTGRRQIVAYNTIRHSGRDLVNIHGLTESLIEYNDLSEAGWLTSDLGMIYGHNTDFGGTEIRYNLVHDNHAPACNMGIYFDHLSHNVIVHHNAVWNVRSDPIRINNPSYNNVVYHNTCWNTGRIVTFDHSKRNDLLATRYNNNIFNVSIRLPGHVSTTHNLITKTPSLVDTKKLNFAIRSDSKARNAALLIEGMNSPDIGALKFGQKPWSAGHDFTRVNTPVSVLKRPKIGGMNLVQNACFELASPEHWTLTGAKKAKLTKGNGWGNSTFGGAKTHPTGTSKRELRLGGGVDGAEQLVGGLSPKTRYTLSAWMRVSDAKESVSLGVRGFGGKAISASSSNTGWTRKIITFETGPSAHSATVSFKKTSSGAGYAWCDNVSLPLTINEQR